MVLCATTARASLTLPEAPQKPKKGGLAKTAYTRHTCQCSHLNSNQQKGMHPVGEKLVASDYRRIHVKLAVLEREARHKILPTPDNGSNLNQAFRKRSTLIPASRKIARSVPSAMSPE